ncbi:MAG: hypothetical protein JSV97_08295, partial [candidate division WOR-3 bacterium]
PELLELEVLKENLTSQIKGKKIESLYVLKPYVLKNYFIGDLHAEKVLDIQRRGKFLIIKLTTHKIIIHLMLHGSIKYVLPGKVKKSSAALLRFVDGTVLEMNEMGSKKRMSIYVIPNAESIKKINGLGIEPCAHDFTEEKLQALLKEESRQVKSLLCDQKKIAGIGNAYADEILWQAELSPFKITTRFTRREVKKLHQAITAVLHWAIDKVREKGVSESRDFLNIHNCVARPCPRCGERIASVWFSGKATNYCPKCQTKGRKLKDRRLSKLFR